MFPDHWFNTTPDVYERYFDLDRPGYLAYRHKWNYNDVFYIKDADFFLKNNLNPKDWPETETEKMVNDLERNFWLAVFGILSLLLLPRIFLFL